MFFRSKRLSDNVSVGGERKYKHLDSRVFNKWIAYFPDINQHLNCEIKKKFIDSILPWG